MTPSIRSVLEAIAPHAGSFDAGAMATAGPGVPRKFDWRGTTYVVAEVLGEWRETGNYSAAPRDNYVRRHGFRVRVESGEVMVLTAARGAAGRDSRWMLRHIEEPPASS